MKGTITMFELFLYTLLALGLIALLVSFFTIDTTPSKDDAIIDTIPTESINSIDTKDAKDN